MKFSHLLLAAAAIVGVAVSCDKPVEDPPAVKLISSPVIEATQEGGTATITFTSATEWSLRGGEDWIAADKEEGPGSANEQTISLQIAPNEGTDRNASLIIYASSFAKKTVTISQPGAKGDGVETLTIAEFLKNADTATESRVKGVISGLATGEKYYGFTLTDETASVSCPFPSNWADYKDQLENGDTVAIQGKYSHYTKTDDSGNVTKDEDQLKSGTILSVAKGPVWTIPDVTVATFISTADKDHAYRMSGIISNFNATYCSFDLTDDSGTIYVYSVTADSKTKYASVLKNGYKVTISAYYTIYNSKHEAINTTIESYEEVAATTEEFSGTVVAVSNYGFLVKTADAYKYVYDKDITVTVKVGDKVAVKAEVTKYLNLTEYENYTVTVSGTETVTHPTATELKGTAFDSFATSFGYVKFSGKLAISGNHYNVTVTDATLLGSLAAPVAVADTLNGKIVDIEGYYLQQTGSGKYQEFMMTSIAYSKDQTGADQPGEGGGDTNVSLEPGENEVLYTLTNAEIKACLKGTSNTYTAGTITSAGGDWEGNYSQSNTLEYIQFRNSAGSYLTSPKYSSAVSRIVLLLRVNSVTTNDVPRKIYVMPTVDATALKKTYATSSDKYTLDTMSGNYGYFDFNFKNLTTTGTPYEVKLSATGVDQFSLLAYGGACYIDSIYVFCAK